MCCARPACRRAPCRALEQLGPRCRRRVRAWRRVRWRLCVPTARVACTAGSRQRCAARASKTDEKGGRHGPWPRRRWAAVLGCAQAPHSLLVPWDCFVGDIQLFGGCHQLNACCCCHLLPHLHVHGQVMSPTTTHTLWLCLCRDDRRHMRSSRAASVAVRSGASPSPRRLGAQGAPACSPLR